jgi:hypothetical protein
MDYPTSDVISVDNAHMASHGGSERRKEPNAKNTVAI